MATIAVKVVPRAARDEIVGWLGDVLKVRIAAPPIDGRANAALEALLAAALGLPRRAVHVTSGHGAARKLVAVDGLERRDVERLLGGPPAA
jgi:uncharacterized protein (TIGR00251 family)